MFFISLLRDTQCIANKRCHVISNYNLTNCSAIYILPSCYKNTNHNFQSFGKRLCICNFNTADPPPQRAYPTYVYTEKVDPTNLSFPSCHRGNTYWYRFIGNFNCIFTFLVFKFLLYPPLRLLRSTKVIKVIMRVNETWCRRHNAFDFDRSKKLNELLYLRIAWVGRIRNYKYVLMHLEATSGIDVAVFHIYLRCRRAKSASINPWQPRGHNPYSWANVIQRFKSFNLKTVTRNSTNSCKRGPGREDFMKPEKMHDL